MSLLNNRNEPRRCGVLLRLHSMAWVFGFAMVSMTCPAFGLGASLSEVDVIRLARAQDPTAAVARAAVIVAEAQSVGVGLAPNPEMSWERESFPGAGESEDSLLVTMPLDLSPRRSTETYLARANIALAKSEESRSTSAAVLRSLGLFYALLAVEQRGEIQQRSLDRLKQAAGVMTRRREAGTASGYEQARIEVEAEFAASALRETRANIHRLHTELAFLLGVSATVSFSGALTPNPDIKIEAPSDRQDQAAARPSVVFLRAAGSEAGKARGAANQTWLPELAITAGPRMRAVHESEYGYAAGLSVELPFFSRGQGLRAESAARARHAEARAKAASRSARLESARAEQRLAAAIQEARTFDEATRDRVDRLERAAESGYREGQRSLVELLDARRARTTVDFRRLELSLSIKKAEIALRAARGDFE